MKVSGILVTLVVTTLFAIQTQAALLTAIESTAQTGAAYDPSTGDVIITLSGNISTAALVSQNGDFEIADIDTSTALGTPGDLSANTIGFAAASLPEGVFNIGDVLPANQELSTFGNIGLSFTPTGDDSVFVALTLVPEPASLMLVCAAGLMLVGRRRSNTLVIR
jgi:hypothetical protein